MKFVSVFSLALALLSATDASKTRYTSHQTTYPHNATHLPSGSLPTSRLVASVLRQMLVRDNVNASTPTFKLWNATLSAPSMTRAAATDQALANATTLLVGIGCRVPAARRPATAMATATATTTAAAVGTVDTAASSATGIAHTAASSAAGTVHEATSSAANTSSTNVFMGTVTLTASGDTATETFTWEAASLSPGPWTRPLVNGSMRELLN